MSSELRRMSKEAKQFHEFGPFRLDPEDRLLWRDGNLVPLTPKAFETLWVLVQNQPRVLSKDELMERVWPGVFVEESNLAQQISTLRKALGESSGGERYIETVPRRGYRLAAEVHQVVEEIPPRRSDGEPALAPLRLDRYRAGKVLGAVAAAALLGGALAYLLSSRAVEVGWARPRRVAILPFRNLRPDPDADFLGLSLADAIITRLSRVRSLVVRPTSYVQKYLGRDVDPAQVARELQADVLLTGTYVKDGDELRIHPQLVNAAATELIWSEPLHLRYDKLTTIQDQVSQKVIAGLRLTLTSDETEQLRRDVPIDALAYEHHLRGVAQYHADDMRGAIELLERSVERDPEFAPAWAYLGTAYETLGSLLFGGREAYVRAQAAFDRALALNSAHLEARIFHATLLTNTGQVEEAVPLLRKVVAESPNLAQARWALSYAYRFGGLIEASIAEGENARRIDDQIRPDNSVFTSYLYAGRYADFLESLPPGESSGFVTFYRGLAKLYLGDRSAAAAHFERAYILNPGLLPTQVGKSLQYAITGKREQGAALLRHTEQMVETHGVADPEGIYKMAQAYAQLGETEAALRTLRNSIEGGFFCHPYFSQDVLLQDLRDEAEFSRLMELARRRHEEIKRVAKVWVDR